MAEPTYLKCTRPHAKKGKQLKFVCLMEACRQNSLCCQQCNQDYHEGHSKKELKALLSIAQFLKAKGPTSTQHSQNSANTQALLKIVHSNESKTINAFKALRQSINATLEQIESNLESYFQELNTTITKPKAQEDPIQVLQATLNDLASSNDYNQAVKSIQTLLLLFNKVGKDGHLQPIENNQDALERFISQSNKEIADLIEIKINNMRNILSQSSDFIAKSTSSAKNLWENPLFNFSKTLCHHQIEVKDSTKVVSGGDSVYVSALMQPQINMNGQSQVFRFKICKLTVNWIAVGVAFKKITEENQFTFDPYNINHGAFMISANGGAWAHQTPELNGKVRSFKFEEGDIITCIVDPESKKIYFVKESDVSELHVSAKEKFELSFNGFQEQPLHPCVTIHYVDNSIEYIPATNTSQIPKYDYLFSSSLKHAQIEVINTKSAIICDDGNAAEGYRSCLFNKAVFDDNWNTKRNFSFRIANCGQDWVGVGICKKAIVEKNSFDFDYENTGHGYYMISSNGGVWSSTDEDLNNKLCCWTFKTRDVIDCEVQVGEGPESTDNKIIFKKGKHNYVLPFTCYTGEKLYPCAMLYYLGDEVAVLPLF